VVVAGVLVGGALIGSAYLGKRHALERAAQALGEANACLYGGPLDGETRQARLLSIELCEKHLNARPQWPSECLARFTAFRQALEDAELQNDERFREVHSLAEPKLDDESWPDRFAEAAATAGITQVPAEAKKWCRTPPLFSAATAKPLAMGLTTDFRFESDDSELRLTYQTPQNGTHACLLRELADGPEGRCYALPKLDRADLIPSEDPGIVAVRDASSKRLFLRGTRSSQTNDVSAVSAFARDGTLLEILEGKVRVTRGNQRGELVRWPALDAAEGGWNLVGDRVLWTEKRKDGRTLWIQTAGAGGEAIGEPVRIGTFASSLAVSLPGDVATCALDRRRTVVAVVDEKLVRVFMYDGASAFRWGQIEVVAAGQPRISLTDTPKLGCRGQTAFLAWKDGDLLQTAHCGLNGCEKRAGKAQLSVLRPLATAGDTVVLVDKIIEEAGGAIVLRRGLVGDVLSSPPSVVALDTRRGGPLTIRHVLHVVSTKDTVWIVSAPERAPGVLVAFRVDAKGNVAAVRPAG
jgi:hypothetical protein